MTARTDIPAGTILSREPLLGIDTNAFAILATVNRGLRRAGNTADVLAAFQADATAGDYEHLLATAIAYTDEDALTGGEAA